MIAHVLKEFGSERKMTQLNHLVYSPEIGYVYFVPGNV